MLFSPCPHRSAMARPRPWPQMEYENRYVEVVTGEELPPIKLKTPPGAAEVNRKGDGSIVWVKSCELGMSQNPGTLGTLQ